MTTVTCLVCNSQEMEIDTVIMQGKWSRLLNYSNKKYNAISCKDCGYTMLFKQSSKFNILEAIMGVNRMVNGEIDPRSVDAMENFKKYSEDAQKNMKALQTQMDKFTNSMSMTKAHSTDLRESLRQMGGIEPFKQMEESIKGVQEGLEKTKATRQAPQAASAERRPLGGVASQEEQGNVTVNLRIDVSGVTDRTDKKSLAKEISAMVTKELRSKIGGPLSSSGFSRSG